MLHDKQNEATYERGNLMWISSSIALFNLQGVYPPLISDMHKIADLDDITLYNNQNKYIFRQTQAHKTI